MARRPKPWFWKVRGRWFVTINGQRHDLGPEKNDTYEQFHGLMRRPQKKAVTNDSLAAIIDAFLESVSRHRSADTYEWYRYRLQRFITRYPDLTAAELKPYHVETWADSYDFSTTSRRNYLRSVKRCMKWAKKQGYVDANPIAEFEVPAGEAKEVYVSPDEFETVLSFARNDAFRDLLEVTYDTGCRPQELLRVTAEQVEVANHRWVFTKAKSKGNKISRVVYLPDRAMEITRRLLLAHPSGKLFRNTRGNAWTTEAVNCAFLATQMRMGKAELRRSGESISDEEVVAMVANLQPTITVKGVTRKKRPAELRCEAKRKLTYQLASRVAPRYSLYALRHSWATNALKRGIDPLTVAILMGHQDPSMLSKVYQHLSLNPEHMLEQAKRAAG